MMHPYLVSLLLVLQGLFMLIALAGFVFLLLVAWRCMKAHEAMAAACKDAAISLIPRE
jgi:hypothetical protein